MMCRCRLYGGCKHLLKVARESPDFGRRVARIRRMGIGNQGDLPGGLRSEYAYAVLFSAMKGTDGRPAGLL
jgi:hypothetical protein